MSAIVIVEELDLLRDVLLTTDVLLEVKPMIDKAGAGQVTLNINQGKLASFEVKSYHRVK